MPIRTPRVTLITRRDGARVRLPAGVPVELTAAEIEHLERDSPDALMPSRPEDPEPADADPEDDNPGAGQDDGETEEERLAREAVERAKAGKAAAKPSGKGKGGKPASADTDGL